MKGDGMDWTYHLWGRGEKGKVSIRRMVLSIFQVFNDGPSFPMTARFTDANRLKIGSQKINK